MGGILRNLTLRQIEAFLLLGEKLSFSRAADAMSITQSAFSQLIRELESGLDLRLFDRTTRRVRLTDAGSVLLRKMKRGVAEIDEACEEARAIARVEHGHLAFDTLPSLAMDLVTRALGQLRRNFPGITISMREDPNDVVLARVSAGDSDFAVCAHSAAAVELDFEHLFDDELIAVMPENHAKSSLKVLPWAALRDETLVMTLQNAGTRGQISTALARYKVPKPAEYIVGNMFTALSMVRAGFGITFIPVRVIPEVNMTALSWLHLESPAVVRRIGICRRKERTPSPAALKFQELLRAEISRADRK